MSGIQIGSPWFNRCDGVDAIVKSVGNDCVGFTQIINGKECFYSHTSEEFKEYYEPKVKADMVNHPPHYKDASGVECIEVTEQGRKDDSAKRRYSLLPTGTVNSVVDVLDFGAIKYAPDNWQKVPDARRRYYDAAMRHIDSWFGGEVRDKETKLPHLAHAVCCLLFLIWFDNKE